MILYQVEWIDLELAPAPQAPAPAPPGHPPAHKLSVNGELYLKILTLCLFCLLK